MKPKNLYVMKILLGNLIIVSMNRTITIEIVLCSSLPPINPCIFKDFFTPSRALS